MSSQEVGIEEARKRLGDLVTAVQQGADVVLTRNGKPAARIVPIEEPTMLDITDLTTRLGLPAHEQSAVLSWTGEAVGHTWTESEADELVEAWSADAERIAADS